MNRKLLILIVLLVLLGGVGYGVYNYVLASNKAVIRTELSARSREFLSQQQNSDKSSLARVNLKSTKVNEHDFDSQFITVDGCYSLIMPFPVIDDRQNDPCVYYALVESPRGSVTTSLRTVGFTSVEDAPDVTMRRNKKEQYTEEKIISNNTSYLLFTDKLSRVEKSAFVMLEGKLFTVSLSVGGDDAAKQRQIIKMLESVKLE